MLVSLSKDEGNILLRGEAGRSKNEQGYCHSSDIKHALIIICRCPQYEKLCHHCKDEQNRWGGHVAGRSETEKRFMKHCPVETGQGSENQVKKMTTPKAYR